MALVSFTSGALAITEADFGSGTTFYEGYTMPYRFYVPAGYSSGTQYPLIIFLHGSNVPLNQQLNNRANGAMALAEDPANPAFMLAPYLTGNGAWQEPNKQIMMHNIIELLQNNYSIDPNRIYITGLSYGCTGTWGSLQYAPNFFAAAIPIAGAIVNDMLADIPSFAHVPVWQFHRAGDMGMPTAASDNAAAAIRNAGGNSIYTKYVAGTPNHSGWYESYASPSLRTWMFAQTLGNMATGVPICQITTPSTQTFNTDQTSIALSGTAAPPAGGAALTGVAWKVLNPGGTQIASGTATFTAPSWTASVPLAMGENRIQVIATGPSWASLAGTTTLNDTIWVTRGAGGDVTAPTVTIVNPASNVSTTSPTISLSGTAWDASSVASVTWTVNNGAVNSVTGSLTSWSISNVPLQQGVNVIRVTAKDPANNSASAEVNVTYTVPPAGQFVAAYNAGTPTVSFLSQDDGVTLYAADPNALPVISGGSPATISPVFEVAGTLDDTLFHSYRHGNHSWNISSLPPGQYRVRLRFAANSGDAVGTRVFNVSMEGAVVLSNFDIRANPATPVNTARDQYVDVTVNDGTLNIQFTNITAAPAKINAIEVRTAPSGLASVGLTGGVVGSGSSGSSQVLSGGDWQVTGTGAVLGGSAESGWYEKLSRNGNFQAVVKLKSLSGGADARAGLMIREGSGAGARTAFIGLDPSANSVAAERTTANQTAVLTSGTALTYPDAWLLIERVGDTVRLAVSSTDSNFTLLDTVTLSSLTSSVDMGLYVTGGGSSAANAVFSGFEVTPLALIAYNCGKTSTGSFVSLDDGVTEYLRDPNGGVVSGGSVVTLSTAVEVDGTDDDALFQTYRYDNHTWNIPVASGDYKVILRFISGDPVGIRLFNIAIEGTTVRSNFDIRSNPTTALNTVRDEEIPVTVTDGVLNIQFSNVGNSKAKINAIKVVPAQ